MEWRKTSARYNLFSHLRLENRTLTLPNRVLGQKAIRNSMQQYKDNHYSWSLSVPTTSLETLGNRYRNNKKLNQIIIYEIAGHFQASASLFEAENWSFLHLSFVWVVNEINRRKGRACRSGRFCFMNKLTVFCWRKITQYLIKNLHLISKFLKMYF